ncbi:hypothetical protein P879_00015, partial [Paragonimus westermani]
NRYRHVYIGGDGSGLPWEQRVLRIPTSDVVYSRQMPSAAILLIHPLQLSDSGEYRCEAQLSGKRVFSEQKTVLNVTKPKEKVHARLRFSSDDPELSYIYGHLITSPSTNDLQIWTVPVGLNLTLFCLYEGAPIVPTRWYFDGPGTGIRQDANFGILIIESTSLQNEATYTCSSQTPGDDAVSKSFKIKVQGNCTIVSNLIVDSGGL